VRHDHQDLPRVGERDHVQERAVRGDRLHRGESVAAVKTLAVTSVQFYEMA
jgi:hypothetical protein